MSIAFIARRVQCLKRSWYLDTLLRQLTDQRSYHQLGLLLLCIVEVEVKVRDRFARIAITVLENVLDDGRAKNGLAAARDAI